MASSLAASLLAACGGGGGGTGSAPPDTTRPEVVSVSPTGPGVALDATISVTFSEPVEASTISSSTFVVSSGTGAGKVTVVGFYGQSASTVTFAPNGGLQPSTTYDVLISTGVKDKAGNALQAAHLWSFTTGTTPATPDATFIPPDNAIRVSTGTGIRVTFAAQVNILSVTNASFDVTTGGVKIPGSVALIGNTAVFRPATALQPNTSHVARTTAAVKDIGGNPLPTTWSFTTGDGVPISNTGQAANTPQVAVDGGGNVTATWVDYNGATSSIYAARRAAGTATWGAPVPLGIGTYEPMISVNGGGDAVVVWWHFDASNSRYVYASRYHAASGTWDPAPTLLATTASIGCQLDPTVAVDGSGSAMVVWCEHDGVAVKDRIYASKYTKATGSWSSPLSIEDGAAGTAEEPSVKMDGSGNAHAIWRQYDTSRLKYAIYGRRFDVATGTWGGAAPISINDTGHASLPRMHVNGAGDAVAAWSQIDKVSNMDTYRVYASTYASASKTWATPVMMDGATSCTDARVVMDGSGNATVVWNQLGTFARRWSAGTQAWGAMLRLDDGNGVYHQAAVDGGGRVTVVWHQHQGTHDDLYVREYQAATGWGDAFLAVYAFSGAFMAQVASNAAGTTALAWVQANAATSKSNVFASTLKP
jgi:hypothetical protein